MVARRMRRAVVSMVESLEPRRLMSVAYGTNLIANAGAETYKGTATGYTHITPTGWTAKGDPTVVLYTDAGGFPTATSPGPASRAKAFFSGGPDTAATDFFQTIDLSSIGAAIDAKQVKLALSGYLGGFSSQGDNATLTINFENASKAVISHTSVGPVTAANRKNITGMLLRSTTGTVPAGTRFAQVQVHFARQAGSYNDGYADNLSLILTGPAATTGKISGTVFNDANRNKKRDAGEAGLAGVVVDLYLDVNGKLTFDLKTSTDASGNYQFIAPAGTYVVRQVIPAGYTQTVAPATLTLTKGGVSANDNFGDKHV